MAKISFDAYDIETTGLKPYSGHEIFAFCCGNIDTGIDVFRNDWKSYLQCFFDHTERVKIAHNMKFELGFTDMAGIDIPGDTVWHDTMIMSQMLQNDALFHGLDKLCDQLCDDEELKEHWRDIDKQVDIQFKRLGNYSLIEKKLMHHYQIHDGERTLLLFHTFYDQIKQNEKLHACYLNEIEFVKVAQQMEKFGIKVSVPNCKHLIEWMNRELDKIQPAFYSQFGEFINLNSNDQISRILFDVLKLPILKYTDGGKPKADKDTLMKLREDYPHPVLDLIFKQRAYTKGISIVQSYLDSMDEQGLIHANLKTNHAATGRQACTDPNLQNVSKAENFKTPYPIPARECFLNPWQYIVFLPDYSGIEMRLGVQGTNSPRLIEMVKNNFDFHKACAIAFYGDIFLKEQECFTFMRMVNESAFKEVLLKCKGKMDEAFLIFQGMLRSSAKNARFAMFYGAGKAQTARTLSLPIQEVSIGYDRDREMFPEFYTFMDECTEQARDVGYIETFFGRRLNVPHDRPYAATDYKIQGSAAEIMKRAMVNVNKWIHAEKLDIHLIMSVHDELIFALSRKLLSVKVPLLLEIEKLMLTFPEITVPLAVEWKQTNTTWAQAKKVKLI